MILLLVAVGGAVGAVARYLTDRALQVGEGVRLPWGTLTVNIAGSVLLGLLTGAAAGLPGWVGALAGTGFCGAMTTYSTFGHETLRLVRTGRPGHALLYVALTLAAGLGGAAAGWALAT